MTEKIDAIIAAQGWILADGATGTNYFRAGLETGYPPELWNVERGEDVMRLHSDFINAGSQLVLTNSFGGTAFRLKLHNEQHRVHELNLAAARLARDAADKGFSRTGRQVVVAGSMGPTGELFTPMGALNYADAKSAFTQQAEALAKGGADLLWIETMSSLEEVEAAIDAAKSTGLPVAACMSFDTAARSMMGVTPDDFARQALAFGARYVGANCGIGPAEILDSVRRIMPGIDQLGAAGAGPDISVIAKGNCGIPAYVEGEIHYHGTPDLMAQYALFARDAGIRIIGGCCGTTPDHIAAMSRALIETPLRSFDEDAAKAALGIAWKDLPTPPSMDGNARSSKRRNRRCG